MSAMVGSSVKVGDAPRGDDGATVAAPRAPVKRAIRRPTMTRDQLKARILEAIDRRAPEIIRIGETIRKHPELGFKEVKTARLVEDTFKTLGLAPRAGLAFTGVRADVAGGAGQGPTFTVRTGPRRRRVTCHTHAIP